MMKKLKLCLLTILMSIAMTSCAVKTDVSEVSSDIQQEIETTEPTKQAFNEDEITGSSAMPVISITTIDQSDDVLDFVTEPVASHVSEQIASWTPNYKMPPAPYYELCSITITDADKTVVLDSAEAQVKVRGNWTTTYAKKPLRIKFTEKQSVLDLNDGAQMKNWVLLAEYKDGSMLRDKTVFNIASELFEEEQLYSADSEFAEVFINGEYWGVYLLTEQQQINSNRVNITEAAKDYQGTDIGYFLEFDGYFTSEDALSGFAVDYADNAPLVPFDGNGGSGREITCFSKNGSDTGFTIKSDIYSQAQHDFIASYMNNVYRIMYYAAYEDKAYIFNDAYTDIIETTELTPQEAIEKVVNVNSLADMYIISELACDADLYWSSFFMSVDFGATGEKKLRFEAPWDYDSAMGNKDRCADGEGFYAANILTDVNDTYETVNPWLAVLMYEDWFCEIIRERWTAAYDDGVFERAYEMIENDTAQYEAEFTRNYAKWNNLVNNKEFASELTRKAARCKTHKEASDLLLEWLKIRVEFMNGYWHE